VNKATTRYFIKKFYLELKILVLDKIYPLTYVPLKANYYTDNQKQWDKKYVWCAINIYIIVFNVAI